MNRFSYLKVAAIVVVLAVALIGYMPTTTARVESSAAPGAEISNEYRIIAKYTDDLVSYDKQTVELGRRARLVNSDLDPLQNKADDLKRRLSEVQNAIRQIVIKLKAADEWNDDLDKVPARITDPGFKALFQESSLKQDLEEASSGLSSHANEISTPLDNLRKKLTGQFGASEVQFVRAAYKAPAPFGKFVSVRCSILVVKTKIIIKLPSVNPSSQHARETWAACHPGQAYPF